MKKKGFATSAILYTLLLLFLVLMVGILNNLQNKKTILDALKKDTINALEKNTVTDAILDQVAIINSKIVEIETKISNYEANTYTKTEVDNMFHSTPLQVTVVRNQSDIDTKLNAVEQYPTWTCTKEALNVTVNGLSLYGGGWVIETCSFGGYLYQTAKRYVDISYPNSVATLERSYIAGTWSSWKDPHTTSIVTTGLYGSSNVTLQGGGYVRNGNIVVGNFTIYADSEVEWNKTIIGGLPTSYQAYSGTVEITSYKTAATTTGYIANGSIFTSSSLPGDCTYGVSVTYLAE